MTTLQAERVQLHLTLPYKYHPGEHPRVREYLEKGYRIDQYQRVTDREAIVTVIREGTADA